MPQNPLGLLKQYAMRNVPKPTQQETENNDLRATAIQDQDAPFSARRIGRNAVDALTSAFVDDPIGDPERAKHASWGSKGAQLAMAAPILPKLPIIAPEAYNDVKAGGLRLYSRLTDAFAKAPAAMKPAKAISLAQSGASKEEITLRKLNDFLKGRDPMADIPREDIMGHLAQNPLELDVVRKGAGVKTAEETAAAQYLHELDTKYGQGWQWESEDSIGEHAPSLAEREHYENLQRLADESGSSSSAAEGNAHASRWDHLQTPGPKENYGESLINLPSAHGNDVQAMPSKVLDNTFVSSHWDEPNNLVWSRHNDRFLDPNRQWAPEMGAGLPEGAQRPIGKGRFVEEIQSDWHQQGRERGYKGVDYPSIETKPLTWSGPNGYEAIAPSMDDGPYAQPNWARSIGGDDAAIQALKDKIDANRVPDAPFKDTYHELALKQQLLDAANDPSLEWLGVADADTVSAMEGHDSVRPGTELWYNEKHPAALEKLLSPLGGSVEKANLPQSTFSPDVAKIVGEARGQTVNGPGMWKASLTPELKELIKTRGFPAMTLMAALQQSLFGNSNASDKQ